MEVILKSNNKNSIAKIIALAKKLHITVVRRDTKTEDTIQKEVLKERILKFKSTKSSSFGDAGEWQREQKNDRDLPFMQ